LMNEDSTRMHVEYVLTDPLDPDFISIDFESEERELFSNNANLKNQYINLELQKTATELQKSFLYPTLSFQAGVQPAWSSFRDLSDAGQSLITETMSLYGNLSLRYTLFNNWKSKRAVEVSRIQEDITQVGINNMKKTLSMTLLNLVELYNARIEIVRLSEQNVHYAERAYELGRNRFLTGSINSIELLTLANSKQSTEIQHYENLFNCMDTYLEIYKMTGKLQLEYEP